MNRPNHFEIYTDNPEATQLFYKDVFRWNFQKFEGGPIEYWLVTTGDDNEPGINGGLTRPREGQSSGTINTVAVESLEKTIAKIEQSGGKICVPKMPIPKLAGSLMPKTQPGMFSESSSRTKKQNDQNK